MARFLLVNSANRLFGEHFNLRAEMQLGTTADRHTVSRLTYNMSIGIHTMYVDRHTVCQLTYCMSIEIHQCMYANRHTVCWLTYSNSIDIHGVYVDRHTVCQSTYYMSVEILYVDRLLCLTEMRANISIRSSIRACISAHVPLNVIDKMADVKTLLTLFVEIST